MTQLDRVNINRALAKAIAYKECGKDADARTWTIALLRELQQTGLIKSDLLSR